VTDNPVLVQRANRDLRCNSHFHTVFLDGAYSPDGEHLTLRSADGIGHDRCALELDIRYQNRRIAFAESGGQKRQ
jgi:hypothetical protein